jgi:hypothetical protein
LVVDFVFRMSVAWVTAAVFACVMMWAWFIEPALHRSRNIS